MVAKAKNLVRCDYCGSAAELVSGDRIYPHRLDLAHKKFFLCDPCEAYVGCHPNTVKPLGRLANAELRRSKSSAHAMFDPIWQSGKMTRKEAYAWLARELSVDSKDCHIGMFNIEMCAKVLRVCMNRKQQIWQHG
jgi:hypothetical protein